MTRVPGGRTGGRWGFQRAVPGAALLLALLLAGLLAGHRATAAPLYGVPYLSYPVGRGPTDVAMGDFTGDGPFDLVTSNFLDGTLTLHEGQPDGQFRAPRVVAQVDAPTSLVAADIDFDGDPDLIVTSYDPGAIIVLGNDGASFTTRQYIEALGGPIDAVLTDVNLDFRTDIVAVNFLDGTVVAFAGFQSGFFADLPTGTFRVGTQPIAIVAGDLNGDGLVDLAIANHGSADVTLLPADPAGFFRPGVPYPLPPRPADLVGGDMNGDGRFDLVVGFDSQGSVASLISNPGFSFEIQTAYPTGAARVSTLHFADLNGDRIQDLVALDDAVDGFRVLRGLGNGGFATWQRNPGARGPTALESADFNEDGVIDLALAGGRHAELGLHLGRGDGRFGVEHRLSAPLSPLLLKGDLDGNGFDDVVALGTDPSGPGIVTRLSVGGARLQDGPSAPAVGAVEAATLRDLDGNGRLDLALVDAAARALRIFLGDGTGAFAPAASFPLPDVASALLADDWTGDGRADLAVALGTQDRVDLYLGDPAAPGGFRAGGALPTGRTPLCLAAADFDLDGRRDLVVGLRGAHQVVVYPGSTPGLTGTAIVVVDAVTPTALRAADLDDDGRPDLVLVTESPDEVRLLRATGGFQFEPRASGGTGAGPVDLELADLSGDGRADYLVGCALSGVVSTWLSSSGVSLRNRSDLGVGAGSGSGSVRSLMTGTGTRPLLVAAAGAPEGGLLTFEAGEALTPIELLEFHGERTARGVTLAGRLGGEWRGGEVRVLRLGDSGEGLEICRPLVSGAARFACEDPDAPTGFVSYRLEVQGADGGRRNFPPIEVGPATAPEGWLDAGPNPFRTALRIEWMLARPGSVRLDVLDAAGRRVARLEPGAQPAGPGRIDWDGSGVSGEALPAGVYWLRLETPGRLLTRRLVRVR